MKGFEIEELTGNDAVNLALDTIKAKKQAIVFANTKESAEKTAEEISKRIRENNEKLEELSLEVLHSLSRPTKQCERLARCIKNGTAFHHAGLTHSQRQLIEDAFRNHEIKIICSTPTLCLSRDAKIWHGMSETEVSNFKASNKLLALYKNKLISIRAKKIEITHNSSKLLQIYSVSGHLIKVTPNHRMFIKRNREKIVIEASKIKKGDKIATIGKIDIKIQKTPSIENFVFDNYLPVKNLRLNEEICYLIGAMLGDGYSGAEFFNNRIKYKGSPCITGVDNEIFRRIEAVCTIFNISCRKNRNFNGVPQLILGKNKWFREFLCRSGVEKGENKHISEKFNKLNVNLTSNILKGLFDTDGYVLKTRCIGVSSISEKLIKQIQKLLLRQGIVSAIRSKNPSTMKIHGKQYDTKKHFELNIANKKSILDFYRYIGFNVERKHEALINLVAKILSNVNYFECNNCNYKLHQDLFSGRSATQKKWGNLKFEIIKLLGQKGELGSGEISKILGSLPIKKEIRLNHHYELIRKRRIGQISKTEWYWSLNEIGKWVYENIIQKDRKIFELLNYANCQICGLELNISIKKGWRDSDFEGDIFWDVIRSVKEVNAEEEVYDVILPSYPYNDHMLVADGFIVHNSAGIDMPAFRTILKDLKRFGRRGMQYIPVLEYLQMAGRAGRPRYDNEGQAIAIANSKKDLQLIYQKYVKGEPEEIYSKLGVEPVFRTYLLSLVASEFTANKEEVMKFFSKSFYAYQFRDFDNLGKLVEKTLNLLKSWEFIKKEGDNDFVAADRIGDNEIKATLLGKRVAELYIDPLTAHHFIIGLKKAPQKSVTDFSLLQLISSTLEMRPLLRARASEFEEMENLLAEHQGQLITEEPLMYDEEYDEFINSIKTSLFFIDWIDENDEEFMLEKYRVRPGEIRAKLENADWLLYSLQELARMLRMQGFMKEIIKLRIRIKYGVKEELLPLLKLKNIGRVRARKLYTHGIRDIGDVKKAELRTLMEILGEQTAKDVKQQVGERPPEELKVREGKRKGQINLGDYNELEE